MSTGGLGGGQESTPLAAMSTLAHHGIIFVPFGYSKAFAQLTNLSEVHGGKCLFFCVCEDVSADRG
jgi:NAD(P)H dehydrogenase (quinone)